ncbi:MAG: HAD-IC family P-type ATPase [Candidatus Doudnabacteria bacterium]|nr:HAD-IC family P-type ATPase [Candidatus Doudnabacteria bacterium]
MNWHQFTKNQIASELGADLENGLGQKEAKQRLFKNGPNSLPEIEPDGFFVIFLRQFKSPLIYILLVCAIMVYFLGETVDALIILTVLVSNAFIGAIQEGKSGKVFRSLKRLAQTEATVLRGGVEEIIMESEVVVGDILILSEGQKVPADSRVIFSYNLTLDEAAFTGETGGILKKETVLSDANLPVSSQHNMVFKGTSILTGNGRALVVATGINTELGKISKVLLEPEEEIPLQKDLRLLSRVIIYAIFALSVLIFILGLSVGKNYREMFALVVSLAVSIIPEGLPLVLTVILASGVWRMSKRNALVKKLQAVEALGQAKVIAVDKTGTITENQMVVKRVFAGGKIYRVSGNGYNANGKAFLGEMEQIGNFDLNLAGLVASLASRSTVKLDKTLELYKISGDPTEAAMTVFGEKMGFAREIELQNYRELEEIPFDYKNKFRAVFYQDKEKVFCAAAGAPEVILRHAGHFLENGQIKEITAKEIKSFENILEEFSSQGFRVVAFGFKHLSKNHPFDSIKDIVFGGFYCIEDAVRPEAREAVKKANEAGVKVVMITGDLKATAKAIAKEAGIFYEGDLIITGSELQGLDEKQLSSKLSKVSVFARVTPEDKMKIIKAYKHAGIIIAMTGDGVNDAPSLVAADLGVAMGKIGTEVAKEAADIVLLDDNLGSIVAAIKEGRIMYENIRKSLQFLFSTSFGELGIIVIALFLKMPLPLLAVQILWMNLVTDSLIAAALALEKEEAENHQMPRSKYFIDRPMLVHIILVASIMTFGGLYLFNLYNPISYQKAMTVTLTLLCVFQWYNGLNCRFTTRSIFHKRIFGNKYIWLAILVNLGLQLLAVYSPFMQKLLKTTYLSWQEWLLIAGLGLVIILAEEIRKLIYRLKLW